MEFEDMLKYVKDEGDRIYKAAINLMEAVSQTEDRFFELSRFLFSKKNTRKYSEIIPEEFHPWNVLERINSPPTHLFKARPIYEEAIKIYEKAAPALA